MPGRRKSTRDPSIQMLEAIWSGNRLEVVNLLKRGATARDQIGSESQSAMHIAVEYDEFSILKTLVSDESADGIADYDSDEDGTVLGHAIGLGRTRMVQYLVNWSQSFDQGCLGYCWPLYPLPDKCYGPERHFHRGNLTALQGVSLLGNREMFNAVLDRIEERYKQELMDEEMYADILNQGGCDGFCPLSYASIANRPDFVSTLLECGANPNNELFEGRSDALVFAFMLGHDECADLLRRAGARPSSDLIEDLARFRKPRPIISLRLIQAKRLRMQRKQCIAWR